MVGKGLRQGRLLKTAEHFGNCAWIQKSSLCREVDSRLINESSLLSLLLYLFMLSFFPSMFQIGSGASFLFSRRENREVQGVRPSALRQGRGNPAEEMWRQDVRSFAENMESCLLTQIAFKHPFLRDSECLEMDTVITFSGKEI